MAEDKRISISVQTFALLLETKAAHDERRDLEHMMLEARDETGEVTLAMVKPAADLMGVTFHVTG